MSICININPDYPASLIRASLDHFRILYAPLNEISIVGATDTQQARDIEASIPAPRNVATDSTFSEVLPHIVDIIHLADVKSQEGFGTCIPMLYEQARAMILNISYNDKTAWSGWMTDAAAPSSHFELLILCVSTTNFRVHRLRTRGSFVFSDPDLTIAQHMGQDSVALIEETGVRSQL